MPTIVTVGVSRKLSANFQSQGFTLNIQAELPGSAVEDPQEMARATSHLFQLADDLMTEQLNKTTEGNSQGPAYSRSASRSGNGHAGRGNGAGPTSAVAIRGGGAKAYVGNGNGGGNGHGNGYAKSGTPGITQAQAKAIESIAGRMNQDADRLAQDEFGLNVADLSVRSASELIDILKKQIQASETQGGRR